MYMIDIDTDIDIDNMYMTSYILFQNKNLRNKHLE